MDVSRLNEHTCTRHGQFEGIIQLSCNTLQHITAQYTKYNKHISSEVISIQTYNYSPSLNTNCLLLWSLNTGKSFVKLPSATKYPRNLRNPHRSAIIGIVDEAQP